MSEQLDENKLIAERRAKLAQIRENCAANGHPNQFRRENYSADLQMAFGDHDKESLQELDLKVSVAGRIMAKAWSVSCTARYERPYPGLCSQRRAKRLKSQIW